jgi:small subunit ribosomal protein S1
MQEGVEKRPLADDPAVEIGVEAEEAQDAVSGDGASPQQEVVAELEAVEEELSAVEEGVEAEDTGEEASESPQPVMEQAAEDDVADVTDDEDAADAPVDAASVDSETIPPATRPGLADREDEPVTMESLLQEDYDFRQPRRGDILSGVVISVGADGILVDVGVKQEGIVPASDIEKLEESALKDIKMGDEIPVYVLRPRDRNGNLLLSIHRAQAEVDWTRAQKLMESGEMWEGEVSAHNQGGLVVQFGKIRGFLPASQVVGIPRHLADGAKSVRLESLVGEPLPLKVIEVDRRRRRLIFSHRAAWWEWKEVQRDRLLDELKEGDVRKGIVSSLRDFGAFVDLGGADGLIHVSELAWHRVKHPGEILKVGDEIEVSVLNVDRDRKRIGLSRKRLKPEPWSVVEDVYNLDQLVEGVVTRVVDFGAFVKINNGVEGLVHRSELADNPPQRTSDLVKEGDLLLLRIIRIEGDRRRIGLSLRRVTEEEWSEWAARFRQDQPEPESEEAAVPVTDEPAAAEPVAEDEPIAAEPAVEKVVVASAEEVTVEPEAEEDSAPAED